MLVIVLLPTALVVLWLVAEFRWRRSVRVALGIACMLVPFMWLSGVIYTSNLLADWHRFGLCKIERLLHERREPQVRRALRVYDEAYQQTGSAKAAVFRMNSVLLESNSGGTEPAPGTGSGEGDLEKTGRHRDNGGNGAIRVPGIPYITIDWGGAFREDGEASTK